jgi:hypothetical protein
MEKKINRIYNITIISSTLIIILSILQIIFKPINVENYIPIAISFYASIGLICFGIDKYNFSKKSK